MGQISQHIKNKKGFAAGRCGACRSDEPEVVRSDPEWGAVSQAPYPSAGLTYGEPVVDALRVIAKELDYFCDKRLKPTVVNMAPPLMGQDQLWVEAEILEHLGKISVSTLRRKLPEINRPAEKLAERQPPKR